MWTAILFGLSCCAAFLSGFLLAAVLGTGKQADRVAECAACEQRLGGALIANDRVWLAEEPRRLDLTE